MFKVYWQEAFYTPTVKYFKEVINTVIYGMTREVQIRLVGQGASTQRSLLKNK